MNFNDVNFLGSSGVGSQLPEYDKPEICFSGRSNVGKSSLINKLVGRKALARVSTKPGKTVTVNFFGLRDFNLADLPGYGYAKVSFSEKERWSGLMEDYFSAGRDIRLVVQLVDMRHDASSDDIDMINYLISTGYNFVIALTKSDKLNKTEREKRLNAFKEQFEGIPPECEFFPFSSQTGEGVEKLKELIEKSILKNSEV